MAERIKVGDTVEWNTSQGKTKGTVKRKLTAPTKVKGHKVAASSKKPALLVESSKTGKKAAHKPEALKKAAKPKSEGSAKRSASAAPARKKAAPVKTAKKVAESSGSKPAKKTASKKLAKAAKAGGERAKTTAKRTATSRTKTNAAAKPTRSAKKAAAPKTTSVTKKPTTKAASRGARSANSSKKTTSRSVGERPARINGSDEAAIKDFRKMVNLTASQLERWLSTKESKKVGFKDEGKGESTGHESGRRILKILGKRADRFTDEDVKHIHRVVAFIKRHLAQKPKGDFIASNWRYSLMNWGHDPAK